MQALRFFACWLALGSSLSACREQSAPRDEPPPAARPEASPSAALSALQPLTAPPLASETVALEQAVQRSKLSVPPRRLHEPRLAFVRGALGQLTNDQLVIYDATDFHELLRAPLEAPRAVLARADGGLLALGSRQLLHWQPGWKSTKSLARPSLLPSTELYADPQQADRLWVFDAFGSGSNPPTLTSYRLVAAREVELPLPEQTVELASPRGGVLGTTREGVWLYLTPGRLERLSPGGVRLPGASWSETALPAWLSPTRRLDRALWIDDAGNVLQLLVSPHLQKLGTPPALAGRPFAVAVGDQGRLVATVEVTGEGPRFELELRDTELHPLARVPLPADAPTGRDDWLSTVTANQMLTVAPSEARVAVGGPARLLIFDGQGRQLFPKPSQ